MVYGSLEGWDATRDLKCLNRRCHGRVWYLSVYIARSRSLRGVCCLGLSLSVSLATLTLPRYLILDHMLLYVWTFLAPGKPANTSMFILFSEVMNVHICLILRVLYPKLRLYIVSLPLYCAGLSFWLKDLSHEAWCIAEFQFHPFEFCSRNMLSVSKWPASELMISHSSGGLFYHSLLFSNSYATLRKGSAWIKICGAACCFFSSSGVGLLANDIARYVPVTRMTQQGFSSCIIRFRPRMYRLEKSGLICLATLFIPTSSGYHDVPYWRPFAYEINLTRCNCIVRGTRLLRVRMLSFGIVSRVVVEYVGLVAIAEQMCLSQPEERWAEGLHFGTKVISYSPKRDSKPRPICGWKSRWEAFFALSSNDDPVGWSRDRHVGSTYSLSAQSQFVNLG